MRFVFSILFIFFLILPPQVYSFCLKIPAEVKVKNATVKLGDIVQQPEKLPKIWREIVLGNIAIPGSSLEISKDYLIARLLQTGITFKGCQLDIPSKIKIIRDYILISKDKIEKIACDCLYKKHPWKENIQILEIKTSSDIMLPPGKISFLCELPLQNKLLGSFSFPVAFFINNQMITKVWVSAKIKATLPVVVTTRPLIRGQVIRKEDVKIEKHDFFKVHPGMFSSIEEVVGKEIKVSIGAGEILTRAQIKPVPLIHRGEIVTIIAESDVIKITVRGKAKEDGCKGDLIRVVNLTSKKTIYGRVIDHKTVKVEF